jgi:tetratricopeptide (TPR) repeat protein
MKSRATSVRNCTIDSAESVCNSASSIRNRYASLMAACLIVAAGVAAYSNSFLGPFIFDDLTSIPANPTIRDLTSLSKVFSPPRNGETVSGRPILNLSLAISYATGGEQPWDYHAGNLLIHLINGLLLWAVLRQTFQLPVLKSQWGGAGNTLAWVVAMLWIVHPLQTESVTYMAQRAESLASLFYLLTLYGTIRGSQAGRPIFWHALAVTACWLGVATKEIVGTAPMVILLYDRTFLSGSFREAIRRRWGLYLGLTASWIVLGMLQASTGLLGRREEMKTFGAWAFARSQPGVILHYLRLAFWPHPLCLDYGWQPANTVGAILPASLAVGGLAAASIWGLTGGRKWGFLGAWLLLILAPSSSIVPLRQLVFEHRMYLPLAAVVTAAVVGFYRVGRAGCRDGWLTPMVGIVASLSVTMLLVVLFGFMTARRNEAYRTALSIWQDTRDKAPHNAHAHYNVGTVLSQSGMWNDAIENLREAIRLAPDFVAARNNMGQALANIGQWQQAIEQYRETLRYQPDDSFLHDNLAIALSKTGQHEEAIKHHQEATRLNPKFAQAHASWGDTLVRQKRFSEAVKHYREASQLEPDNTSFLNSLAFALAHSGHLAEAAHCYQEEIRLRPDLPEPYNNLAIVLAGAGRMAEAVDSYRKALRIRPGYGEACLGLSQILTTTGELAEALDDARLAVRLLPDQPQASQHLAWLLATQERISKEDLDLAVKLAEHACVMTRRQDAMCLDTLGAAYAAVGRFDDAVKAATEAEQRAQATKQASVGKEIHAHLELYRERKPCRASTMKSGKPAQ